MADEEFMKLAVEAARKGLRAGEMPFGACIVKGGRVLAVAHNSARQYTDTTAHAEMQAIKEASRQLRSLELSGYVIYSTCEPCPMCFSACLWARLSRIVFGTSIQDAAKAGIRQIPITAKQMKQLSGGVVEVSGGGSS